MCANGAPASRLAEFGIMASREMASLTRVLAFIWHQKTKTGICHVCPFYFQAPLIIIFQQHKRPFSYFHFCHFAISRGAHELRKGQTPPAEARARVFRQSPVDRGGETPAAGHQKLPARSAPSQGRQLAAVAVRPRVLPHDRGV